MAIPLTPSQLGIFARTFVRPSLEETLDEVRRSGLRSVQLNLSSAGMPTLPERLPESDCARIARALSIRGLRLAAISGTFNLIDPDLARREENLNRLDVLAASCRWLDTRIVTLCTGTRDRENMWRYHPENESEDARADLVATMGRVVAIADRHEVTFAFEPEAGNVVNSAVKARRLIDEVRSPWLKVVLDPANLCRSPEDLPRMAEIVEEAFALLAADVALLHVKELGPDGKAGDLAPGDGVLDFVRVARLCVHHGLTDRTVILHGLPEGDVQRGARHVLNAFLEAI